VQCFPVLIVEDSSGCYVSYSTNGTVSGQTNTGSEDIVVARFKQNGDLDWVKQQPTFSTVDPDTPVSIVADSSGCYLLYPTSDTISGQTRGIGLEQT